MTNLEYLRTMSSEQITKWLYEWWIPKGQYAWNSSSGALTMLLNKEYGDNETEMLFGTSLAEAEQREWVVDEYGIYHCPVCHAINNTVYKNYCPNCRARMKGGEDE